MNRRVPFRALTAVSLLGLAIACGSAPEPAPPAPASAGPEIADPRVHRILVDSCYPCHANERSDPWYARLAPSSWSSRGREALNFSDWERYDVARRTAEIVKIAAVVKDGSMPLKDYTFFNRGAKLAPEQKKQVVDWANERASAAH